MSTNQAKADPYELKRRGRGGAVYRPSVKGGGGGGGGVAAGPSSHPGQQQQQQQHSVRPNAGRSRRANGQWQYPNSANGESHLQPAHRPHQQHQHHQQQHHPQPPQHQQQLQAPQLPQQVPGNVPASRRTVQNNGTIVKPVPPSTPEKPQPDSQRAAGPPVFQFGSFSPAGHNVGMQIPARTASAPPNLDEQKREQAHFEASLAAAKHIPVLPHGPVMGDPTAQHHMPQVVRPVHMPVPVQVVASQPQGGMQPPGMVPQHGMVQPGYTQGAVKYQPPPPVMASQVTTPIVGGPPPMMGHPQVPPSYSYPTIPPRVSKAIRIVNPKTQEEVRLDAKAIAESRPPPPPPPAPASGAGAQQPQARVPSYAGAAGSYQPAPLSTTGAPFYPHGGVESPRFSYSASVSRGAAAPQAVSSLPVPPPPPPVPVPVPEEASVKRPESPVPPPPQKRPESPVLPPPTKRPESPVLPPPAKRPDSPLLPPKRPDSPVLPLKRPDSPVLPPMAVAPHQEDVAAKPDDASQAGGEEGDAAAVPDEVKESEKLEVKGGDEAAGEFGLEQPTDSIPVGNVEAEVSDSQDQSNPDSGSQAPPAVEADPSAVEVELKPPVESLKQEEQNGPPPPPPVAAPASSSQVPGSKKKNKKKLLAKADAAGSSSDLYNAYKTPDEKSEPEPEPEPVSTQQHQAAEPLKSAADEEEEEEDAPKELEDWEDAADLPSPAPQDSGKKRYTRDFLLACRDHNVRLPADFELRPDVEPILQQQQQQQQQHHLDPGPRGGPRRGPEDDRWLRLNPFTPGGPRQDVRMLEGGYGFRPGSISPGPRGFGPPMMVPPHLMPVRSGAESGTWHGNRGLIPSPHTPLPPMHKAENRYEVREISDDEEKKQRQIKGILNKLTPQNFDRLFEQVKDVGISTAGTLTGVISQIFDKAVMEPTFCETYAKFCVQLSVALPEFNEEGEKVTFKRVLLNKCQEEFERGKREEEEAGKAEEDGVSISREERDIKRVNARRRMLGNIRFIGELYKKSMLTERIMHQCIKTLLGEYQDPDEEDVEALCKLMTTIGLLIDHSKAKAHMDAYFERILSLSNNQKLSSRLRFGLKDVIDLRKNDWQQRRKVEGPKKIEEVHRDAHQERLQAQTSSSRSERFSSRGIGGMSGRRMPPQSPAAVSSPMGRGASNRFSQDLRKDESFLMESGRPMAMPAIPQQRPEEISFVPQGGLGRGPLRGASLAAGSGPPKLQVDHHKRPGTAGPYTSRDEFGGGRGFGGGERPLLDRPMTAAPGFRGLERSVSDRVPGYGGSSSVMERPSTPPTPSTPAAPPTPVLSDEQLKKKSSLAIEEYYSARDVSEVVRCVEELARPDYHSSMISNWISESFEKKDVERDLLAKLIKQLRASEPVVLTDEQMREGLASFLSVFEDVLMDVPRAADYLGALMGKLVADKVLQLAQVTMLVKEGGQDKGSLLQSKDGLNIFGSVLETIRKERSEAEMLDLYRASGVSVQDFVLTPRAGEVEEFLKRRSLQCLDPIFPVESYLKDALEKNTSTPDIFKWLEANAASLFTNSEFLRMVMAQVLNHAVLPLPAADYEVALKGRTRKYSDLLKRISTVNPRAAASTQRQYIAAVQLFAHRLGHPSGLMTALFNNFYDDEVIPEIAFQKWEDDVRDTTPGREQAIREVGKWLKWLAEAPEEED